jgi:hypothetical protein
MRVLKGLQTPPSNAVGTTTGGLETARQMLASIASKQPGTEEATAANEAKRGLDSWSNNVAAGNVPDAVLEGNMGDYLSAAQDARGNWAAAKRSDTLTGMADRAAGNADAGNGDLAQKASQRANAILNSPRLSQGRSDGDRAALEGIRSGVPFSGLARATNHGEGNTLWCAALLGMDAYLHGGVPGAIAAAAGPWVFGQAAQGASNAFARGAMGSADAATRLTSPLFEQMVRSGQSAPVNTAAAKLAGAMAKRAGAVIRAGAQGASVFANPPSN